MRHRLSLRRVCVSAWDKSIHHRDRFLSLFILSSSTFLLFSFLTSLLSFLVFILGSFLWLGSYLVLYLGEHHCSPIEPS